MTSRGIRLLCLKLVLESCPSVTRTSLWANPPGRCSMKKRLGALRKPTPELVEAVLLIQSIAMDRQIGPVPNLEGDFVGDGVEDFRVRSFGDEEVPVAFDIVDPPTRFSQAGQRRDYLPDLCGLVGALTHPDVEEISHEDQMARFSPRQALELLHEGRCRTAGATDVSVGNYGYGKVRRLHKGSRRLPTLEDRQFIGLPLAGLDHDCLGHSPERLRVRSLGLGDDNRLTGVPTFYDGRIEGNSAQERAAQEL